LFTSIVKKGYCTSSSSNTPKISEKQEIINELNINPVYIYEDLDLEETKKKCITNTRPVVLYNLDRTVYGKILYYFKSM